MVRLDYLSNIFRHSFWNDSMKWLIAIFLYTGTILSRPGLAALLDPIEILYLAEINDFETLCHSFEDNEMLSLQEAHQFLLEIFHVIQVQYPSEISFDELDYTTLEIIKNCPISRASLKKIEPILIAVIEQLIPSKTKSHVVLIKSPLKRPTSEIEIPASVIFGTTEIICGALLWLTPFRTLSIPLIGDGLRRMGNAVEEKEKELREHPRKAISSS